MTISRGTDGYGLPVDGVRVIESAGSTPDLTEFVVAGPGKFKIWHPHELRMTAPDQNGQDTAYRYLHTGTGYATSFVYPCPGVRSLTFFCMFGAVNATPTPTFVPRIFPNTYDNAYGSVDVASLGGAMTANSSQQHARDSKAGMTPATNDLRPLAFQFLFRSNDAAVIMPISVWVVGGLI